MSILIIALTASAAFALENATLKVQQIVAPELVLPGVTRVLVVEQDGVGGGLFASATQQLLLDQELGAGTGLRAPVAMKLSSMEVKQIRRSGAFGSPDVPALSAAHQAQVIATGTVSGAESPYTRWEEERSKKVKTESGEKEIKYKVDCAQRTVQIATSYHLYGADGGVLLTKTYDTKNSSKDCDEDGPGDADFLKVADADELWRPFVSRAAEDFVKSWRPHYQSASYSIFSDRSTQDTVASMQNGRWEAASQQIASTLKGDPYNFAQVAHAAQILTISGQFDAAEPLYQLAERYTGKVAFLELAAQSRARQQGISALSETYHISMTPNSLPVFDALVADARQILATPAPSGQPMIVKALVGRDVDLSDAPKKGAKVGAVPVGVRVYVTSEDHGASEVQLPDGRKTAWIRSNNLKNL